MKKKTLKKVKFGPPVEPPCPPFLYYWCDITEIFKQYVSKRNIFCSWQFFHLKLSSLFIYKYIYINYINIYIYIKE